MEEDELASQGIGRKWDGATAKGTALLTQATRKMPESIAPDRSSPLAEITSPDLARRVEQQIPYFESMREAHRVVNPVRVKQYDDLIALSTEASQRIREHAELRMALDELVTIAEDRYQRSGSVYPEDLERARAVLGKLKSKTVSL